MLMLSDRAGLPMGDFHYAMFSTYCNRHFDVLSIMNL